MNYFRTNLYLFITLLIGITFIFNFCNNKTDDKTTNQITTNKTVSTENDIPNPSKYTIEQYFNMQSAKSPSLSADNKKIIYRTNETNTYQVYLIDLETNKQRQLTNYQEPISFAEFSPTDPNIFVFGMDKGGNEKTQLYLYDLSNDKITQITDYPKCFHNFGGFSLDGKKISYTSNRINEQYFDIYEYSLETNKERLLYKDSGLYFVNAYSDDGNALIFGEALSNFDYNLYIISPIDSQKATLLTPHEGEVRYEISRFNQNKPEMLMLSDLNSEFLSIFTFNFLTQKLEKKFSYDHDITSFGYSHDGKLMYFIQNDKGYDSMHIYNTETSEIKRLKIDEVTGIRDINISKDNKFMVMNLSISSDITDIYKYTFENDKLERLTTSNSNGIDVRTFQKPTLVEYETFDGKKIHAWLYLPIGAKKDGKFPCIIIAHGGPESQFRPFLYASDQFFIAKGYALFAPNIRGSTGYGKTFSHLDDIELREDSIKDIVKGVDWLKSSGYINPNKIVIEGGSYGGYVVMACLTLYPDIWAAGIDSVGIVNFITFLKNTSAFRRSLREAEYGYLDKNKDFLEKISPINKIDRIKAPLMVIHGKNDPRVPVSEAEQVIKVIKEKGGIVEPIIFDNEGHGISKRDNQIQAMNKKVEFLDKYVKNK